MSEPALVFDRVTYSYAFEDTPRDVVTDLSFSIEEGEWVGVTGPTNAGKSTLCLLAMGLAPHFFGGRLKGRVTAFGQDSAATSVIERSSATGLLFQNPFTQISGARERVDEEVAFGPECHGLAKDEVDSRVQEAMELTGIAALAARHPLDLSGGQLQRLALAGLLAMRPRLLLLDEPTSQLDPAGVAAIFEVLQNLHGRGTTILMVEHRLEAICDLCPRVMAIAEGRVIADGAPALVFNDGVVQEKVGLPVFTRIARATGLPRPWPVTLAESSAAFVRTVG